MLCAQIATSPYSSSPDTPLRVHRRRRLYRRVAVYLIRANQRPPAMRGLLVVEIGDARRHPSRLNSDTSHLAGNRQTEERYDTPTVIAAIKRPQCGSHAYGAASTVMDRARFCDRCTSLRPTGCTRGLLGQISRRCPTMRVYLRGRGLSAGKNAWRSSHHRLLDGSLK